MTTTILDEWGDPLECLDDRGDGTCQGPVEYWSSGGIKSWPRCTKHGEARLNNRSELERYADSDVPPPGFDPAYAGERWDDDY